MSRGAPLWGWDYALSSVSQRRDDIDEIWLTYQNVDAIAHLNRGWLTIMHRLDRAWLRIREPFIAWVRRAQVAARARPGGEEWRLGRRRFQAYAGQGALTRTQKRLRED